MHILQQMSCTCKVNKSWPFLVHTCKHGNPLVNRVKPETKAKEVGKMQDALL